MFVAATMLVALSLPQWVDVSTRQVSLPHIDEQLLRLDRLHRIRIAFLSYYAAHDSMPFAVARDGSRHSWRTLLLPHLDAQLVYNEYNMSFGWNSVVNTTSSRRSIDAFQSPSSHAAMDCASSVAIVVAQDGTNCRGPNSHNGEIDPLPRPPSLVWYDHVIPSWAEPRDVEPSTIVSIEGQSRSVETIRRPAIWIDSSGVTWHPN